MSILLLKNYHEEFEEVGKDSLEQEIVAYDGGATLPSMSVNVIQEVQTSLSGLDSIGAPPIVLNFQVWVLI